MHDHLVNRQALPVDSVLIERLESQRYLACVHQMPLLIQADGGREDAGSENKVDETVCSTKFWVENLKIRKILTCSRLEAHLQVKSSV